MLENFLTITSPPILLSAARRKNCLCFKLPYIGPFSVETQPKIKKLVSTPSFNIKSWFGVKDLIPAGLRSRVIYKFSWAGCSACYVGETNRHVATRIPEHLSCDKHSHIFKHLRGSENCGSFFKILDSASTSFQLKIAMKPCTSFGSSRL